MNLHAPNILLVVPNPFVALDANGDPCGFCFTDPVKGRRFQVVGGTLQKTVIAHEDEPDDPKARRPDDVRDVRVRVRADVALGVHRVVNTEYHRARILSGDLIAADTHTWKTVGGKAKDFRQPVDELAAARDRRVVEWMAEHDGEEPPCADVVIEQRNEGVGLKLRVVAAGPDGGVDLGEVGSDKVFVAARFKGEPSKKAVDEKRGDEKRKPNTKKTDATPTA